MDTTNDLMGWGQLAEENAERVNALEMKLDQLKNMIERIGRETRLERAMLKIFPAILIVALIDLCGLGMAIYACFLR